MPVMLNEQSISRHQIGMPRQYPVIIAKGMMSKQVIMPNSITHLLPTGSRNDPMKRIARTK